ncbi:MAG: hypothetical protein JXB49_17125 [Bacteroidales bacterium]|nr:hypothetical protein [Bacteroidales bacterium]
MKLSSFISIKFFGLLLVTSLFFSCPDLTYVPSEKQRNWEGHLYDDGSGRYSGNVLMSLDKNWHFTARVNNDAGYTFWWNYYIEGDIDINSGRAYISGTFPEFYEDDGFIMTYEGGEFITPSPGLAITDHNSDYSVIVASGNVRIHAKPPYTWPEYYYNKEITLSVHKISGE